MSYRVDCQEPAGSTSYESIRSGDLLVEKNDFFDVVDDEQQYDEG